MSMVSSSAENQDLLTRYLKTRKLTEKICSNLDPVYFNHQPVHFVSPPKWHLAHTSWFFEEFILVKNAKKDYYNPDFPYLFNSYYNLIGDRIDRDSRGKLDRPLLKEVMAYREYIDEQMMSFIYGNEIPREISQLIHLGLNHEQQHQELLLTDIKYILGHDPVTPAFHNSTYVNGKKSSNQNIEIPGGVYKVGHEGEGFAFDNESGAHSVFLHHYTIEKQTVTNKEYICFINDDGYKRPELWLADGWDWVKKNAIELPLYWKRTSRDTYERFGLTGTKRIADNDPVSHVSFYEADAYARWKGKRLPTEFEWEVACKTINDHGASQNFAEHGHYEPVAHKDDTHMLGNVWEWTNSSYLPYPYYKKPDGAVGEYNGKFMINQMVLRGGSCATPKDHIRVTYRNFFYPHERWQFSGIRLAEHII